MFPVCSTLGSRSGSATTPTAHRPASAPAQRLAAAVRLAGLAALLSAGLPAEGSAQSIGTLQATARVVPAAASWEALEEARTAALLALQASEGGPGVRRTELVRTSAVLQGSGEGRRLLVTIQHPRN
ncbi:MAG TPA: hypothetical protein VG500_04890 [Gemmatimonadales bacterium]|jgi:hypothetical protein|nr:hypothetical protein [Gemmatimonadales bacterium]